MIWVAIILGLPVILTVVLSLLGVTVKVRRGPIEIDVSVGKKRWTGSK